MIAGAATGFRPLDWTVVVLFLLWMLWIGYRSGRRNRTAEDYVLGGRTMNPVMVGISLFATLLSTLSYLSYPGEMVKYGPVVFIGLAAFPVAYYIVSRLMIPRYMKMNVTSAYEILEIKLGRGVRSLATVFFLSLRFLWMATIIYATVDVALIPVFGLDPGWVPPVSVVLVVITVIYTTMGGLKAVVTTDVIQTVVMFAGVLLTIGIIGWKVGSFGAFFEPQLFEHWPPVDWGFDMSKRMTVGNILLMTLVWQVCTAGSDQMAIQRYLSTPDVATAKRSYRISLVTSWHDPVVAGRGGARRNDLFPPLSADARAGHLRGGRCRHAFPPFYPDRAAGGDYRADRRRDHVGRDVEPLVGAQFVCHGDL